ncbi:MAG: sulfatase-like hydrolase/transferase, partial [Myxococcota bacterium]
AAGACVALGRWAPVLAPLVFWPHPEGRWTAEGPAPAGRDVVLITVDTLRVDAARAMRHLPGPVRAARTSSPWTLPSLASLHTGLEPGEHGALRLSEGFGRVADHAEPLAEVFARAGWDTAATVESPFCDPAFGLHRGFARYRAAAERDWIVPRAPTGERARSVAGVLLAAAGLAPGDPGGADARVADVRAIVAARRDRPLFLWVHLLDPHLPYRHAADPELRAATRVALLPRLDDALLARLREAYAREVDVVDGAIARVREALPGAIVAVTSDHGEEFGEHGGFEHGHTMYEELLAVPLATNEPALDGVVATRELARALPAAAGVPGATFTPDPTAPRTATNPLYGPLDLRAVRVGDAKRVARGEERWSYDLAADPGERSPGDDVALEPLLPPVPGDEGAAVPIGAGMRAQLEALGYVEP